MRDSAQQVRPADLISDKREEQTERRNMRSFEKREREREKERERWKGREPERVAGYQPQLWKQLDRESCLILQGDLDGLNFASGQSSGGITDFHLGIRNQNVARTTTKLAGVCGRSNQLRVSMAFEAIQLKMDIKIVANAFKKYREKEYGAGRFGRPFTAAKNKARSDKNDMFFHLKFDHFLPTAQPH